MKNEGTIYPNIWYTMRIVLRANSTSDRGLISKKYKELKKKNTVNIKNTIPRFKMGYRYKHKILKRGNTNGSFKEMFGVPTRQGNVNQNYFEIPSYDYHNDEDQNHKRQLMLVRMWERWTLIQGWWKPGIVQPVRTSVCQFLAVLGIDLPQDPAAPLLGIYPKTLHPAIETLA